MINPHAARVRKGKVARHMRLLIDLILFPLAPPFLSLSFFSLRNEIVSRFGLSADGHICICMKAN